MSKQLVKVYAGYSILEEPTISVVNFPLSNEERLTVLTVEWNSTPDCTYCGSYPTGKLLFTLKLQAYNNEPSTTRKRKSYAVLGSVTVWILERKRWKVRDWHRLSLRESGVIEIPRALSRASCVINHPISLLGPLVPYVYDPLPVFIDPLVCPPCFESLEVPFIGYNDDFNVTGCNIVPSRGSNAICIPIPDCAPVPELPVLPAAPGWPAIPATTIDVPLMLSSTSLPDFPIPPPCYEWTYKIEKVVRRLTTAGSSVGTSVIHYPRTALASCPPVSLQYSRVVDTDVETGTFMNTFPVWPYQTPGSPFYYSSMIGDPNQGTTISYEIDYTVSSVLIPCGNTQIVTPCKSCVAGVWEVLVAMKGKSPTLNSGAIPTQFSRVTIDGNACCQPSLEPMTAENSPDLYDPDFRYYVWSQCGVVTVFNQAVQNVYVPQVVATLFKAS